MSPTSPSQDLCEFAVELRRLAYALPGGCEDPLIRLSERMAHAAAQHDREIAAAAQ
jgi:hypothetical protein